MTGESEHARSSDRGRQLLKAIGPGLLLAGAAIGVSHLVQATRAGAEFRFGMIGLLILACATKYPFLEFGPRYAAATGNTLIEGYRRLGAWALWTCFVVTFGSMFIIMAALTIVTASLAGFLFHPVLPTELTPLAWSGIIITACMTVLVLGRYPVLDRVTKFVMAILLVSTLAALAVAVGSPSEQFFEASPPSWLSLSTLGFILAFMGWMPIPIDSAIWHSLWIQERCKQTGHTASMRHVLMDFNIGYILAGVVAVIFLSLGALVMFGREEPFLAGGAGFAEQLIRLYGETLGSWSVPIIAVAAFTTMFSTTLIVLDAFPRVMQRLSATLRRSSLDSPRAGRQCALWVLAQAVVALAILAFMAGELARLVDLATTLSFLTAPILAFINYRVVTSNDMPAHAQPSFPMRIASIASMIFLTAFSIAFVAWRIAGN